jgi:hypothetical protein
MVRINLKIFEADPMTGLKTAYFVLLPLLQPPFPPFGEIVLNHSAPISNSVKVISKILHMDI